MLFIIVLIPLKIKKIARKQQIIPSPRINGYKLCSLFLKELFITTGPINNKGNATDKKRIPFCNFLLLEEKLLLPNINIQHTFYW